MQHCYNCVAIIIHLFLETIWRAQCTIECNHIIINAKAIVFPFPIPNQRYGLLLIKGVSSSENMHTTIASICSIPPKTTSCPHACKQA